MRTLLTGLAITFEVIAAICEEAACWCADHSETEEDRDERLQRGDLDRLWQQSQHSTPAPPLN